MSEEKPLEAGGIISKETFDRLGFGRGHDHELPPEHLKKLRKYMEENPIEIYRIVLKVAEDLFK